jgi:tetratricopeptide (TPR) repeat protein
LSLKEVSAHYRKKALGFISRQPTDFARLLAKKMSVFLQEVEASYDELDMIFLRQLKWRLDINPITMVLPLAALGIMLSWRTPDARWMALLIASQLLIVLAFFFINRFRAAIFPFLIIYEVVAIDWLISRWKAKKFLAPVAMLAFLMIWFADNSPRPVDADTFDHLYLSKKGYILEQKGDDPMALVAYRQALDIRPRDTTLLFNLGNIHMKLSFPAIAKEYYIRTLQINPLHVDAAVNLGYVYESEQNYDQAIQAYERALQLSPASSDVALQLSGVYVKSGQCAKAQWLLNERMAHDPTRRAQLKALLNTCINK